MTMENCTCCGGTGLVCEFHLENSWAVTSPADANSCGCGAGMPCLVCKSATTRMTTEEAFAEAIHRAIEATAREFR
jgi:hypothetical protein